METLRVRKATKEDAAAIAEVHVKTWQSAYVGLFPQEYLNSLSVAERTKTWEKTLSDGENKSTVLVCELEGNVVGWCGVGPCRDEDTTAEQGELWAIYVLAGAQGHGVGSLLMEDGLGLLREMGFTNAVLWVLTDNKKARGFYESKGWKTEGKRKTTQNKAGIVMEETRYSIIL